MHAPVPSRSLRCFYKEVIIMIKIIIITIITILLEDYISPFFFLNERLLSKETVVPRRCLSETQQI